MTSSGLKWYSELREELRKYGISVDDIQKLAKLVNHLKQYDYNVEKVINEFSDLEGLKAASQISSRNYTVLGKQKQRPQTTMFYT